MFLWDKCYKFSVSRFFRNVQVLSFQPPKWVNYVYNSVSYFSRLLFIFSLSFSKIFDYQHHMGLLLFEKKELACKYEQVKSSAETAEIVQKSGQAAHLSALAEARKREENLKKVLGVEKECIASVRSLAGIPFNLSFLFLSSFLFLHFCFYFYFFMIVYLIFSFL